MNKSKLYGWAFIFLACSISALALCTVQQAACANNLVLRLSNTTNAHAETASQNTVGYQNVCCDMAKLTAPTDPQHVLLDLSAPTNAHVKRSNGFGAYPVEINVTLPVYYPPAGTNCTAGDECVVRISDVTNAHVSSCTDNTYDLRVCVGNSGSTTSINMRCGNVSFGTIKLDPACNDIVNGNTPTALCPGYDDCVYNDSITPATCLSKGDTHLNTNGRVITCSLNSTWCPENMTYSDVLEKCDLPLNVCNSGYDLGTGAAFLPKIRCFNLSYSAINPEYCFWDFNLSTAQIYPPAQPYFNQSCCFISGSVGFQWTNQSQNYSLYSPLNIKVW